MRKALHAIFMTIALIMVFSCGKESFSDITPKPVPVPDIHEKKTAENNPIDGYYDKWVDIVRRMLICCRETELELLLNSNLPEIGSLSKLHIYDAAGNAIRFADLPKDEQLDFIEAIAGAIAAEQHRKAEIAREVTDQYYILDGLMSICQNSIRRMTDEGAPVSSLIGYFTPERGWSEITKDLDSFRKLASGIEFPIVIGPLRPEFLSFESFRNQMAGVGKKGMLVVQLPIHGRPNTLWNLSNYLLPKEESAHIHRALGHTNILTGDFLATTEINDSLFYGVDTDRAGYENLKDWCTPFYLMEIKSLKFIWAPENHDQPLTMVKETLPEEKIDEFVNDELSFVGSPFVGAYNPIDFLFSKYRMPEYGFTCVGLVWYCAKRVLDIDISIPMLPSIMPVNAICTPYTDIVTIVQ